MASVVGGMASVNSPLTTLSVARQQTAAACCRPFIRSNDSLRVGLPSLGREDPYVAV